MLKQRTLIQALLAATFVVGLLGFSSFTHWYKAWVDEWGPGWHATGLALSARLGFPPGRRLAQRDLTVYVRPKFGFCANCGDRRGRRLRSRPVTTSTCSTKKFTPVSTGSRIRITDLFGRSRLYNIATRDGTRTAWGIASTTMRS